MQEYKDGTTGPIVPMAEMFADLINEVPKHLRKIHIGTMEELQTEKERLHKKLELRQRAGMRPRKKDQEKLSEIEYQLAQPPTRSEEDEA